MAALAADGFDVAAGTLCGALKQIAPLIAPWAEAIAAHGRTARHVHADETSWQVFEDIEGKDGHRWWLWTFVTSETTVFVMDPSRSADVAAGQLGIDREQSQLKAGRRLVISSDFHKAYQSLACIDGVDPLWCFAHIRRYFLRAGAAHPEALGDWADAWTERIAVLYRAHHALAATTPGTDARQCAQGRWQRAFTDIDAHRILQASDAAKGLLHPAAAKVIATLSNEWDGLARHQDLPQLPLDNNIAKGCGAAHGIAPAGGNRLAEPQKPAGYTFWPEGSGICAPPEQLDGGRTIGDAELADDGGNVGPDRAGRQHQPPGDPARGQVLREQPEYLPFTASQALAGVVARDELPPAWLTAVQLLDEARDQGARHSRLP